MIDRDQKFSRITYLMLAVLNPVHTLGELGVMNVTEKCKKS